MLFIELHSGVHTACHEERKWAGGEAEQRDGGERRRKRSGAACQAREELRAGCNWHKVTVNESGWIQMTTGIRKRGRGERGQEDQGRSRNSPWLLWTWWSQEGWTWSCMSPCVYTCGCICFYAFPVGTHIYGFVWCVFKCVGQFMCSCASAENRIPFFMWWVGEWRLRLCVCVCVWGGGMKRGVKVLQRLRPCTMNSVQWFYDGGTH